MKIIRKAHTRQRIGAKGPKMPCYDERSDDTNLFTVQRRIDLRCMQIAKDGVKDSGQYIRQHF